MSRFTGETRYRVQKRCFKKPLVVLQIQCEGLVSSYAGGMVDVNHQKWWIDAKPEHIMASDAKFNFNRIPGVNDD